PTSAPNVPKKYKEYEWKAYDIDQPDQEIDFFTESNSISPTINIDHPYFSNFNSGYYPQFVVKLRVTDFANQIKEVGEVVHFNAFRITAKDGYTRCPETWSYFENTPLVQGGSGNYEFTWTTTSGNLDFQSNDLHDPFPYFHTPEMGTKTYNLLVKMLDGNGAEVCQLTKSIEVEAVSLSLSMPSTAGACDEAGTAIIGPSGLGVQGGSGNFGYEWTTTNPLDLNYLSDVFAANPVIQEFPEGAMITYTLRVGDLTSECMTSAEVLVTGYPNNLFVTLPSSTTVCYGEEVTITGNVNPFSQIYHEWTTNHPKPELVQNGGNGPKKQLTFSEIMCSYPGTYNITLKATDIVSGCTAEATTSLTVRSPWRYKGYVSKIASATKNSSMPLWEPGSINYFTSNPPNLNNIEVSWHPYPPHQGSITYYGNTALPSNGSFTPTKEVPFLTMTVYDNVSGCSKTVKTMRYIISEYEPRLSIFAGNGASCIGDPVCFDLVFDAQLADYTTPLLPDNISALVAINAPSNIPQQPDFKYIPVKLLLENSSGLYKAKVCETDFFQYETYNWPHYTASLSLANGIWNNVESATIDVAVNEISTSNEHIIKCLPNNGNNNHERALSYRFGVQCTGSAVHSANTYTFARDYIELLPDNDLELIPGTGAGSFNRGAYLGIDPCIIPQAVGNSPNSLLSRVSVEERSTTSDSSQTYPLILDVFPNPFEDEVNIEFNIPKDCAGRTSIVLYDITGKEKAIVYLQENCPSGVHQTRFKTDHIPPGIYFCELKTCNNLRITRKLVKIKNH
ncbi:MAG TPA: hypothetical protein DCF33_21890, partial [Saprospirales bacterium]|nr:hypothetical protein [Saprospirales bacterium]